MKILLVEDQQWPLEALERAITKVLPQYVADYSVTVANCYNQAVEAIGQGKFDIVLLDHRLPIDDPGDMEKDDFDAFSDSLQNIGYSLIKEIRRSNPSCVIIGTSSMKNAAIQCGSPNFSISKARNEATTELEEVIKQIT